MWIFFAALMEEVSPPPDEEEVQGWVRAARAGNRSAAQRLYQAHVARIYRTVRPLCRSDAEAEDATQDAFVDALTHLERYWPRPGRRFVGWLASLALNRARKASARAARFDSTEDQAERAVESQGDAAVLRRELLAALQSLPERDRRVVSLRYGAELTADEVADLTGLSAANVRKICERQRLALAAKLEPDRRQETRP